MNVGLIDAGGGMRGIYTSGIYDYLMDREIKPKYCIGVSAGSANLITYIAGQRGRTYRFYAEYAFEKKYMSLQNFIKSGSFIDLNYVYSGISDSSGKDPLDFAAVRESPCGFTAVATNALTGEAHYFKKEDMCPDNYAVLKASCAIPFVCRPIVIDNTPYFDGGVADPLPIDRAFADGCDKIAVCLTKPRDYIKKGLPHEFGRLMRKYPKAAQALLKMHESYNNSMKRLFELEKEGRAFVACPDDCCGVSTLTRNKHKLDLLYQKGYDDGRRMEEFINSGRALPEQI